MDEKYTINIGTFVNNDAGYHDRCLCASFGGSGVQTDAIPWEGTEHNPWDYRAEYTEETVTDEEGNEATQKVYTGEFVLEPIDIPTPITMPTAEERLEALEAVMLEMMGVQS